jgi:hypothetical protein
MKEKIKIIAKKTSIYVIITLSCLLSFVIGYHYKTMNTKPTECSTTVDRVKKNEVNLAIDQNNNLIMINLKTGNYTIYEDSIGSNIFSLYAKNVWGQHTNINQK